METNIRVMAIFVRGQNKWIVEVRGDGSVQRIGEFFSSQEAMSALSAQVERAAARVRPPPKLAVVGGSSNYIDSVSGLRVTVCPPGEAKGARDLQKWATGRGGALGDRISGGKRRIDVELWLAGWTSSGRAIAVKRQQGDRVRIYLPLSLVTVLHREPPYIGIATVTIPEWMAIEKGLV